LRTELLSSSQHLQVECSEWAVPMRTDVSHRGRERIALVIGDDAASPDTAWIERIRSGDREAFAALFRTYHARLCAYVFRLAGSEAVAEELVQEVFARIWERRLDWDPKGSIDQYLFFVAKNRALNHLKHLRVEDGSSDQVAAMIRPRAASPEDQVRFVELADATQHAVEKLPARCRQIFRLSREGHLTYNEIATLLEISPKTVEVQMGRALRALREALASYL